MNLMLPFAACTQMVTWSAWNQVRFTNGPENHTLSAITDLRTLTTKLVDITNIAHDMFCPGAPLEQALPGWHAALMLALHPDDAARAGLHPYSRHSRPITGCSTHICACIAVA